jgi:hypothetical protein
VKNIYIILSAFIVVCVGYFLFYPYHSAQIAVEHSFVIDNDFDDTRKILVRTDAAKRLIEAFGVEVLEEKWDNVTFGVDKFRPIEWDINLHGRLKVRVKEEYFDEILLLQQDSHVERDLVVSKISLIEDAGLIKGYQNHIKFCRDGDKTKVCIRLYTKVGRRIPNLPYLREKIQNELEKASEETLKESEEAIRKLIKERSGKKLLLQFPFE